MIEKKLIYISLFLIYYHIGGLATTNILRLTSGNTLSVLNPKCTCDACGHPIPVLLQLPVISFILCKGKCKYCGAHIHIFPLFLEIIVMTGMYIITLFFKIAFVGIVLSFVFYESVKFFTVLISGKRQNEFAKNYIISFLSMIPFFVLTSFVSLIFSTL